MHQSIEEQASANNDTSVSKLYELTYDATNMCVQCGYCLPVCPTYETMGTETQSPRGRINLVKLASTGKINILEHLAEPIDLCVGCRACEVACPVGVPYGHILDGAKQIIAKEAEKVNANSFNNKVKQVILQKLFPYPKRLRKMGDLFWFYQKSGAYKLVRKARVIEPFSKSLSELEKAVPILEKSSKRLSFGTYPACGEKKARIAFFTGCVTDATMYRTNRLSVELLRSVGCEVIIPEKQKCCGALHTHQGLNAEAKQLAKDNIVAFEQSEAEFFVNNAGGCGAMLSEYDMLLKDEPEWCERAKEFVKNSKDISVLLVKYGPLPYKKEWNGAITYQDSCHLRNVQGIYKEPRELLKSIPGVRFVELNDNKCCGSGGIYNIIHFNESMKILDRKIDKVEKTNAATVATANPGCLLQMQVGINRHDLNDEIKTLHFVDILAEVCGIH